VSTTTSADLGLEPEKRVCSDCGVPAGIQPFCASCGRNLSMVGRLPTRAEWERNGPSTTLDDALLTQITEALETIESWWISQEGGSRLDLESPAVTDRLKLCVQDHVTEAVGRVGSGGLTVEAHAATDAGARVGDPVVRSRTLVLAASVSLPQDRAIERRFTATFQRAHGQMLVQPVGSITLVGADGDVIRSLTDAGPNVLRPSENRNPVGAGLGILAGLLILIGTFLPIHSYGSIPIPENSFVADGDWWIIFVALVVGISSAYLMIGATRKGRWPILVASLIAVAVSIYGQTNQFQKLPLSAAGQQLFGVSSVQGSAAIGVYLVLAGGITGLVAAGLIFGKWRPVGVPAYNRPAKQCPDCVETVLADAKVCKHCGHRF
jgi:hypothetical protein